MDLRKSESPRVVGRYALYEEIAAGGMATVHFGRLLGQVGFARTVAVKRLHPQFAHDPDFVAMFIDEARLAARIRHPNVVQTLDVVATEGELFLVLDYVHGESLSRLLRAARATGAVPLRIASAIMCGALHGLHAAHEATNERGEPLGLVHRDMNPQNVLVGVDGVPRVLDFGVAMASGRAHTTGRGKIKGKLGYMAPEQIGGESSRRSDVFSSGIMLWEILTGRRLFAGSDPREMLGQILSATLSPPTTHVPDLPPAVDAIVMRALEKDPSKRYPTARDMAVDLEQCLGLASQTEVGAWVESLAQVALAHRAAVLSEIESSSSRGTDARGLAAGDVAAVWRSGAPSAMDTSSSQTPAAYTLGESRTSSDASATVIPAVRRRRRVVWSGVGAAVAVIAVLLFVGLRRAPTAISAAAAPSLSAVPPRPAENGLASPSATALASPPATAEKRTPPPGATPGTSDAPSASSSGVRAPPAVPSRAALAAVKRAPPAIDCNPPYSLDAQGHKRWKDACFRK